MIVAQMSLSPVIKQRLPLSARRSHRIAGKRTDVARPSIGNLEPGQQHRHRSQNGRKCNGKLGAHRSAITDGKLAKFAG